MRIAFFIYSLAGGGAERVTSYLSGHWVEKGYEVIIYTLAEASPEDYVLPPSVRRIHLPIARIYTFPGAGLVNSLSRIHSLRMALRRDSPDGLISMMTKSNVLAIPACIGLKIPCVCAERNNPRKAYAGSVWNLLRKVVYRGATTVTVQSTLARKWIERHTWASKVRVIPNPVSYPLAQGLPTLDTSPYKGRSIVLAVGRLEPQKQFEHAIHAFSQLEISDRQWQLIILGDGSERRRLEKLVTTLGLENRVLLPGRAGNMGDWYEMASVLIMSSKFEGFPNVLLEAMSYGVPVVTYNCETGPAEIVIDEVNGYLVEADSVDELAGKLQYLLTHDQTRETMACAARSVLNRFSMETIGDQWLAALDPDRQDQ